MVSLVSELTSCEWKNEWLRRNIRSLDPSLVVVAGMILIRALLICCLSVTIVSKSSHIKSSLVIVVSILVMFVYSPTIFLVFYSFSERCVNRWVGLAIFSSSRPRTTALPSIATFTKIDLNLITTWELSGTVKHCRCEGCLPYVGVKSQEGENKPHGCTYVVYGEPKIHLRDGVRV